MIEIEKLTSMGKMAAGTAHHLNSPLAALLIRTELIRQHSTGPAFDADLARIEEGLHFCRHFVQRLLDFTRAMPVEKAPQDLATVIESIAGFFQPAISRARPTSSWILRKAADSMSSRTATCSRPCCSLS